MAQEESDPARVRLLQNGSGLGDELRNVEVESEMEVDREDGNSTSSTGFLEGGCSSQPEMIPAPDSPPLSVQLPTQQPSKMNLHPLESSSDRFCEPSQAPQAGWAQYEKSTWGQLRDQCSQRGYQEKESKAASKTR